MVESELINFSSSKDNNLLIPSRYPLLKYKGIDSNMGVQIDELRFTWVDICKEGYKNKPFIMESQENKCFMSLILLTINDQLLSKKNNSC